ncbi:hypothetical protein [Bacterioplanoides sp.]|uniref:hypothetical protein n=1 Tax=Bacterioplanoides sp. TaxID=2066072 RepID=UPI003B5A8DCF
MQEKTQKAIDKLYKTFSDYKIEDFHKIGCIDLGPSPKEVKALSNGLKEIPDEILKIMEFYGEGWNSWGSKEDVGYLLPRLMQYLADDISRLDSGVFSLFDFKLVNFFSDSNSDWTNDEKDSLNDFITALIEERLSVDVDIGLLIECALTLNYDLQNVISKWKSNENLYKDQIILLLDHFNYDIPFESSPEGYHFFDNDKIRAFLDSLLTQLTKGEIDEIFSNQIT